MKIAVASGKGGTGKTTISIALAESAEKPVCFLDCDVEEPNGSIFLNLDETKTELVYVPVPQIDAAQCTGCGVCADVCQYNAIVILNNEAMVFPELCHGCGGCTLFCPEKAISEGKKKVGVIEKGSQGEIAYVGGRLDIGQAMSPPVIKEVRRQGQGCDLTIIDAPPGTSCPMIAAVKDVDFILFVTEPTPFGMHDLALAVAVARQMQVPFGVAINRSDIGDDRILSYCEHEKIPVLLEVKESRRVAEGYSRGHSMLSSLPELRPLFENAWHKIARQLQKG
jgi:MinD superfamily P-loop ATPase